MFKPRPDQAAFPTDPAAPQEYFQEDETPENPFLHKWLYKPEGKVATGSLPSPCRIIDRLSVNQSPTLKANKKWVKPQDTSTGNYSPWPQKV